ncbi:MAG: hypothetical protein DLM67_00990 [Candidatus Nephthysia bennettiae]|nr:MAG: hypothetical protein DLM67_00990 [Candidatus Dormibacteraeota bacterium]
MARIVDLHDHCRGRLDRYEAELEEGLDEDGRTRLGGLAIREQVETAMYRHVEEALEFWRGDTGRAREEL